MARNIHPGFWFGVLLFYAGLIVFIVGFACPFWYESSFSNATGTYEVNEGLWYGCIKWTIGGITKSDCTHVTDNTTPEYMKAVEALQVIALIGFAITIILKFTVLCFAGFRRSYRRSIEFTLLASVVSGLLGVAVYGGACRYILATRPMSWAFAIDLAGLIALLLAVFVLAAFNRPWRKADERYPDKPYREYGNRAYEEDRFAKYPDNPYDYGRQQQHQHQQPGVGVPMAVWARKAQPPEYASGSSVRAPYLVPYGPPIPTRGQMYY